MKKLKIFRGTNLVDLEKEVNEWISNNGARFDTTMEHRLTVTNKKEAFTEYNEYIISILYFDSLSGSSTYNRKK